jgi:[protein-PII] uridylyltransferase
VTATPSSAPFDPSGLLADRALRGESFAAAYGALTDQWLAGLFNASFRQTSGVVLVATGGHGAGLLAPASDLDLTLLHDGSLSAEDAAGFWYPIWNAGLKLGHSVRTVAEALDVARTDLATATSLLTARPIAGAMALAKTLRTAGTRQWQADAKRYMAELSESIDERHQQFGDVAYALEPDLKEGRGGIRDTQALRWAAAAGFGRPPELDPLDQPVQVLMEARVELHRSTGRPGDRLLLQHQDDVAERLDEPGADQLMGRVATAAKAIGLASDEYWFDVRRELGLGRWSRRERSKKLDGNLALAAGRIALQPHAVLDGSTALRVAVAATTHEARIDRATMATLLEAPELSDPWPPEARSLLVQLLAMGDRAVSVIESLDEAGLWSRLIPEWTPNRCKPQRNAYHRFTVDRHLLEAVARASDLVGRVQRPDLLLVGALLHDIGKGYPGDHTEVGMVLADTIARRFGFDDDDVDTIVLMVEHHLLLPDSATRRDLDDPATIRWVAACAGTNERLHLLHALTEADSIATGTSAWGTWKAGLVATLVERTEHDLAGGDVAEMTDSPEQRAEQERLLGEARAHDGPLLVAHGNELVVVCADRPGLFSRIAGLLATCGLDVAEASATGADGFVIDRFRVTSSFGGEIDWPKVERTLGKALTGRMALEARLAQRARTYAKPAVQAHHLRPRVRVLNEASDEATVIEVTGPDGIGLLYRLTKALAELEVDIARAKVVTMGSDVVDAFYVRDANGQKITDVDDVAEIEQALLHALQV